MKATSSELRAAYDVLQENCGIADGDTVKVIRKAKGFELGWPNGWAADMNVFVGKKFKVKYTTDSGVSLAHPTNGSAYSFPFFVLEVVKKKLDPELEGLVANVKTVENLVREATSALVIAKKELAAYVEK